MEGRFAWRSSSRTARATLCRSIGTPIGDASAGLERFEAIASSVIALEYFHGQVDRLQALRAAASIRMMQAHQLAVATLDQLQREGLHGAIQFEQFECRALLIAALHARPEAREQALDIVFAGVFQIGEIQIVLAQCVLLAESGGGTRIRQQLNVQRTDLQMAAGFGPEPVAQQIQCVEDQEVRAKQHQLVGQRQIGDVRAVPTFELLDQRVFAAAFGVFLQQYEQVVWQIQCGGEVVHRASLAQHPRRPNGAGSQRANGERAGASDRLRVKCAPFASHPDT